MTPKQAAHLLAYCITCPLNVYWAMNCIYRKNYMKAYHKLPRWYRGKKQNNKYYPSNPNEYMEAQHILEIMEAI